MLEVRTDAHNVHVNKVCQMWDPNHQDHQGSKSDGPCSHVHTMIVCSAKVSSPLTPSHVQGWFPITQISFFTIASVRPITLCQITLYHATSHCAGQTAGPGQRAPGQAPGHPPACRDSPRSTPPPGSQNPEQANSCAQGVHSGWGTALTATAWRGGGVCTLSGCGSLQVLRSVGSCHNTTAYL